jgi:ketosteroid isomerase-like protein
VFFLGGVLLIQSLVTGCGEDAAVESGPKDPALSASQLERADREFAKAAAQRGLDGWMSYFADDAARVDLRGKVTRGLSNIRAADSTIFADPTVRMVWDPTDAGAFHDGNHGFTKGRYQVVKLEAGSPADTLSQGTYLTIWRRDEGEWRVIVDTGAPDPENND